MYIMIADNACGATPFGTMPQKKHPAKRFPAFCFLHEEDLPPFHSLLEFEDR